MGPPCKKKIFKTIKKKKKKTANKSKQELDCLKDFYKIWTLAKKKRKKGLNLKAGKPS